MASEVELFILRTSFDGFQVDFVAAQHFTDFIAYSGPVLRRGPSRCASCATSARRALALECVAPSATWTAAPTAAC